MKKKRRTPTPQFSPAVVDIRVADARRRAIRFLEELGVECPPEKALDAVLDLIKRYDPDATEHLRPELEETMRRHTYLLSLLVELKRSGRA